MIEVNFEVADDGKSLILNISGHAGQNDIGRDIVCSAASILAYTVAQITLDMHKDKKLRKKPTVNLKDGDAHIVVKPLKDYFNEAVYAFYVAETGFKLLAHNYPKFVHLNAFGEAYTKP